MNIFFIGYSPRTIAQQMCDKHVVKIVLEITQMLWTAHHATHRSGDPPIPEWAYRMSHKNHPMSMWVRSSRANYRYTTQILEELLKEYSRRYGRCHACELHARYLAAHIPPHLTLVESPTATYAVTGNPKGCTPVPLAMPAQYHQPNLIKAYRAYYRGDKRLICYWRKARPAPEWWALSKAPSSKMSSHSSVRK